MRSVLRSRASLAWGTTLVILVLLPGAACALTWQIEVADPRHDAIYTSLALDSQDRPHISAFDVGNQALTYTRFDGIAWRTEVVDGGLPDSAGAYSGLALDSQDRPHVSYFYQSFDTAGHYLRYAHFDGTAWRIETVDTQAGGHTSIALDAQGRPHISHCDCFNGLLKYARFDGTAWRLETVDTGARGFTSLKLDAQGRPHISYSAGQRLRYAHFDGSAWRLETVEDLGFGKMVFETSLILDAAGRPHIAYVAAPGGIKYARFDGTSWRVEVADPLVGRYVSLGLDRAGYPFISFYDGGLMGGSLKLARFDGLTWQVETVDSGGVGHSTSLKVDPHDRVHISYNDPARGALKYARGTPEVRLDLQLNQPSFRAGEALTLAVTVTPGPAPVTADAYLALLLPDGPLLFLQGDYGDVEGPQPLVRDWPVTAVSGELFRYTFTGAEPPGTYTWFAALTEHRTLSLFTPLLILPFTFTP